MTDNNQIKEILELTEELIKDIGKEPITEEQLLDKDFVIELSF